MTDTGPDQQFFEIADAVIRAANAQCDNAPATKVSAATLFAAARFNAFAAAAGAPTASEFAARRESIVWFLVEQYTRMLRDNLAEYERLLAQQPVPAQPRAN
jgi:hypothetical protein